jgi:hypothetical protein
MSHWAEIDNKDIVIRVIVGDNNLPDEGEAFCNSLGGKWVKTSYSGSIRKNFAGVGYSYDKYLDAFIPPKLTCHPQAVLFNEEACTWYCSDASHTTVEGE